MKHAEDCERFLDHVLVLTDEDCWIWTGGTDKRGYGRFTTTYRGKKKEWRAHRYAWEWDNDTTAGDLFVCHHCDNTSCCNPVHLFLGTHEDNVADRDRKNRMARQMGELNGSQMLTRDEVYAIRRALKAGVLQRVLGEQYGVSSAAIGRIGRRETWRHLRPE